jgi:hypothetical protein
MEEVEKYMAVKDAIEQVFSKRIPLGQVYRAPVLKLKDSDEEYENEDDDEETTQTSKKESYDIEIDDSLHSVTLDSQISTSSSQSSMSDNNPSSSNDTKIKESIQKLSAATNNKLLKQLNQLWCKFCLNQPIGWSASVISDPDTSYKNQNSDESCSVRGDVSKVWFRINLEPHLQKLLLTFVNDGQLLPIIIEYARPHFEAEIIPPSVKKPEYQKPWWSYTRSSASKPVLKDSRLKDSKALFIACDFPRNAKELIELCQPSMFGDLKTTKTKYDPMIRQALEFSHSEAILLAPEGKLFMKYLAMEVSKVLYAGKSIAFKLSKLNVYGPGGHFVKHLDTPRTDVCGTLLIEFPYSYSGGSFKIFSPNSPDNLLESFHSLRKLYTNDNKKSDDKEKSDDSDDSDNEFETKSEIKTATNALDTLKELAIDSLHLPPAIELKPHNFPISKCPATAWYQSDSLNSSSPSSSKLDSISSNSSNASSSNSSSSNSSSSNSSSSASHLTEHEDENAHDKTSKKTKQGSWMDCFRFLAFYGNAPHMIKPVKEGYRVTASYYIKYIKGTKKENQVTATSTSSSTPSSASLSIPSSSLSTSSSTSANGTRSVENVKGKRKFSEIDSNDSQDEESSSSAPPPLKKSKREKEKENDKNAENKSTKVSILEPQKVGPFRLKNSTFLLMDDVTDDGTPISKTFSEKKSKPTFYNMTMEKVFNSLISTIITLTHVEQSIGIMLSNKYDEEMFTKRQWSGGDQKVIDAVLLQSNQEIECHPYRVLVAHDETSDASESGTGSSASSQKIVEFGPDDIRMVHCKKTKMKTTPKFKLRKEGGKMYIFSRACKEEMRLLQSNHDRGAEHTGNESRDEEWNNIYFTTVMVFQSKTNQSATVTPSKKSKENKLKAKKKSEKRVD